MKRRDAADVAPNGETGATATAPKICAAAPEAAKDDSADDAVLAKSSAAIPVTANGARAEFVVPLIGSGVYVPLAAEASALRLEEPERIKDWAAVAEAASDEAAIADDPANVCSPVDVTASAENAHSAVPVTGAPPEALPVASHANGETAALHVPENVSAPVADAASELHAAPNVPVNDSAPDVDEAT